MQLPNNVHDCVKHPCSSWYHAAYDATPKTDALKLRYIM